MLTTQGDMSGWESLRKVLVRLEDMFQAYQHRCFAEVEFARLPADSDRGALYRAADRAFVDAAVIVAGDFFLHRESLRVLATAAAPVAVPSAGAEAPPAGSSPVGAERPCDGAYDDPSVPTPSPEPSGRWRAWTGDRRPHCGQRWRPPRRAGVAGGAG